MKDLSDRLEWLAQKAGGFRELDRRAGLTEGHTNTVSKRARSKERGEVARGEFGLTAAAAVASAMNVRLEWLATGAEPQRSSSDLLPAGTGVPALRSLLALLAPDTDPALVQSFWAAASVLPGAEAVTPLEWAERFVFAWMAAGKPGPPKANAAGDKAADKAGIIDNFDEAMGRIGAEKRKKGAK